MAVHSTGMSVLRNCTLKSASLFLMLIRGGRHHVLSSIPGIRLGSAVHQQHLRKRSIAAVIENETPVVFRIKLLPGLQNDQRRVRSILQLLSFMPVRAVGRFEVISFEGITEEEMTFVMQ